MHKIGLKNYKISRKFKPGSNDVKTIQKILNSDHSRHMLKKGRNRFYSFYEIACTKFKKKEYVNYEVYIT